MDERIQHSIKTHAIGTTLKTGIFEKNIVSQHLQ